MPQLFQVLRCYKCLVFQVHQTKKSNKFACKICGDKQSIKRHYGLGTAKDCRLHVQKLNGIRGEINELIEETTTESNEEEESDNKITEPSIDQRRKISKWSEYVDKEEVAVLSTDNTMCLGDTEVVLDVPKKRCKTLSRNIRKRFKPPNNVNGFEGLPSANTSPPTKIGHSVNENHVSTDYTKLKEFNCDGLDLNINSGNFIESEYVISKKEEKMPNKCLPLMANSSSKWAKFVDTEEVNDENDDEHSFDTGISQSNPQTFFSLCNDTDLDDVLNI